MQKRARLSAEKEAEPVCEPSGLTPFFLFPKNDCFRNA